jgi:hypothetical protein
MFGHKIGLPTWRHGFLDIEAPELPLQREPNHAEDPSAEPEHCELEHYAMSLATANVQSLYRGPEGHAGKLQYLQEQMRHFKLNYMAIQEARSEAGMSSSNEILRFCGGHSEGQYGMEIWIDLKIPYAWSRHGKPRYFNKAHFQCLQHDQDQCSSAVMRLICHFGCWHYMLHIQDIHNRNESNGGKR